MKCIVNGRIVLADEVVSGKALVYDEKIAEIADADKLDLAKYEVIDAGGNYVAPGLVDMHIHGYLGADVSDGDTEGIKKMAAGIAENGVTSWCPTTMTVSTEEILGAFNAVRQVRDCGKYYGARILGVNCEGPFINPSKKGAQAEEYIKRPDGDFILDNADVLKVFTVAPEIDGADECISKVYKDGRVLVSMGHTGASFDEANRGIEAGVRHATHLFNAMTPLNHRDPGVVGASLADDRVSTELIADTFHISPDLFGLVAKVKGDNLILITDCTRAGGLEDGEYTLGGQPIFVKGIECRLADGTIAGSVLKLNNAIRNMRDHTSLPLEQIVRMASINAARCIGLDKTKGSLEAGKDADIILADENFAVSETIIAGETVWAAE